MWFSFPEGHDRITVEQQSFAAEVTDSRGRQYFRAPEHFAPKILNLPGFAMCEPPDDAEHSLEDLPRADPLRDNAISELTAQLKSKDIEIQNLRADYNSQLAKNSALTTTNAALERQLMEAKLELENIQEQMEDQGAAPVVPLKKAK